MTSDETRLARLEAFFARENARHDAVAASRPTWWNAGKVLIGLLFAARGLWLALGGTDDTSRYVLAVLLMLAGSAVAFEGARLIWQKHRAHG